MRLFSRRPAAALRPVPGGDASARAQPHLLMRAGFPGGVRGGVPHPARRVRRTALVLGVGVLIGMALSLPETVPQLIATGTMLLLLIAITAVADVIHVVLVTVRGRKRG